MKEINKIIIQKYTDINQYSNENILNNNILSNLSSLSLSNNLKIKELVKQALFLWWIWLWIIWCWSWWISDSEPDNKPDQILNKKNINSKIFINKENWNNWIIFNEEKNEIIFNEFKENNETIFYESNLNINNKTFKKRSLRKIETNNHVNNLKIKIYKDNILSWKRSITWFWNKNKSPEYSLYFNNQNWNNLWVEKYSFKTIKEYKDFQEKLNKEFWIQISQKFNKYLDKINNKNSNKKWKFFTHKNNWNFLDIELPSINQIKKIPLWKKFWRLWYIYKSIDKKSLFKWPEIYFLKEKWKTWPDCNFFLEEIYFKTKKEYKIFLQWLVDRYWYSQKFINNVLKIIPNDVDFKYYNSEISELKINPEEIKLSNITNKNYKSLWYNFSLNWINNLSKWPKIFLQKKDKTFFIDNIYFKTKQEYEEFLQWMVNRFWHTQSYVDKILDLIPENAEFRFYTKKFKLNTEKEKEKQEKFLDLKKFLSDENKKLEEINNNIENIYDNWINLKNNFDKIWSKNILVDTNLSDIEDILNIDFWAWDKPLPNSFDDQSPDWSLCNVLNTPFKYRWRAEYTWSWRYRWFVVIFRWESYRWDRTSDKERNIAKTPVVSNRIKDKKASILLEDYQKINIEYQSLLTQKNKILEKISELELKISDLNLAPEFILDTKEFNFKEWDFINIDFNNLFSDQQSDVINLSIENNLPEWFSFSDWILTWPKDWVKFIEWNSNIKIKIKSSDWKNYLETEFILNIEKREEEIFNKNKNTSWWASWYRWRKDYQDSLQINESLWLESDSITIDWDTISWTFLSNWPSLNSELNNLVFDKLDLKKQKDEYLWYINSYESWTDNSNKIDSINKLIWYEEEKIKINNRHISEKQDDLQIAKEKYKRAEKLYNISKESTQKLKDLLWSALNYDLDHRNTELKDEQLNLKLAQWRLDHAVSDSSIKKYQDKVDEVNQRISEIQTIIGNYQSYQNGSSWEQLYLDKKSAYESIKSDIQAWKNSNQTSYNNIADYRSQLSSLSWWSNITETEYNNYLELYNNSLTKILELESKIQSLQDSWIDYDYSWTKWETREQIITITKDEIFQLIPNDTIPFDISTFKNWDPILWKYPNWWSYESQEYLDNPYTIYVHYKDNEEKTNYPATVYIEYWIWWENEDQWWSLYSTKKIEVMNAKHKEIVKKELEDLVRKIQNEHKYSGHYNLDVEIVKNIDKEFVNNQDNGDDWNYQVLWFDPYTWQWSSLSQIMYYPTLDEENKINNVLDLSNNIIFNKLSDVIDTNDYLLWLTNWTTSFFKWTIEWFQWLNNLLANEIAWIYLRLKWEYNNDYNLIEESDKLLLESQINIPTLDEILNTSIELKNAFVTIWANLDKLEEYTWKPWDYWHWYFEWQILWFASEYVLSAWISSTVNWLGEVVKKSGMVKNIVKLAEILKISTKNIFIEWIWNINIWNWLLKDLKNTSSLNKISYKNLETLQWEELVSWLLKTKTIFQLEKLSLFVNKTTIEWLSDKAIKHVIKLTEKSKTEYNVFDEILIKKLWSKESMVVEDHHFLSYSNSKFTNKFKDITEKFWLWDLKNWKWNKEFLADHKWRHTADYHLYILDKITEISKKSSTKEEFLKYFEELKIYVAKNPEVLYMKN